MDKKIVLQALEKLIQSPEWSLVKKQLEEERQSLNNKLMVNAFAWDESQIKATIESIKVYDNIITCPERIFTGFGGSLQVEE